MLNEAPTVAEMAALIDAGGWSDRASPVVKLSLATALLRYSCFAEFIYIRSWLGL